MGKVTVNFIPLENKVSICKVKIVYIGKNLACTKIPEGYVDSKMLSSLEYKYGEIEGTLVRTEATLILDGVTNYGTEVVPETYGIHDDFMAFNTEHQQFVDDDSIEIITTYFVG